MGRAANRSSLFVPPRVRGVFTERQLGVGITLRFEPSVVPQVLGRYPAMLIIRGRVFFCECDVRVEPSSRIDGATLTSGVNQLIADTNAGIRQGLLCHPESGLSIFLHAPIAVFERIDDLTSV